MNAILIADIVFYFGAGFLFLGLLFFILALVKRKNPVDRKLYLQGGWIFLGVGLLLLLRETKLAYLESFLNTLQ